MKPLMQKFSVVLKKLQESELTDGTLHHFGGLLTEDFDLLCDFLKEEDRVHTVSLHQIHMNDDQAIQLAEALKERGGTLKQLELTETQIGPRGAGALAELIAEHDEFERLVLKKCHIGDDGAKAIANVIEDHPSLNFLRLESCEIHDRGIAAVAQALPSAKQIFRVDLTNNLYGITGKKAVAKAVNEMPDLVVMEFDIQGSDRSAIEILKTSLVDQNHKNILKIPMCDVRLTAQQNHNGEKTWQQIETLREFSPHEPGHFNQWHELLERLPATQYYLRTHKSNDKIIETTENFQDFMDFIKALPLPDASQQTMLEAFTKTDHRYPPIHNPKVWRNLDEHLSSLEAEGIRISADDLVQPDGKRSLLLDRALELGKEEVLFKPTRWKNAPRTELTRALNALPEDVAETLPAKHQLMSVTASAEATQRLR